MQVEISPDAEAKAAMDEASKEEEMLRNQPVSEKIDKFKQKIEEVKKREALEEEKRKEKEREEQGDF